jgi:protein translocase SecG subunit
MLYAIFIIQILICSVLIGLVTSSDKEEGGLSGAIGGGAGSRGRFKPGYEERMDIITKYFAIAFFVFSLIIARFAGG